MTRTGRSPRTAGTGTTAPPTAAVSRTRTLRGAGDLHGCVDRDRRRGGDAHHDAGRDGRRSGRAGPLPEERHRRVGHRPCRRLVDGHRGAEPVVGRGRSGRHTAADGGQGNFQYLEDVSETDVSGVVDLSTDKAPTGAGLHDALARRVGNSAYNFRTRFMPDGTVRLYVTRQIDGTDTTLGAVNVPSNVDYVPATCSGCVSRSPVGPRRRCGRRCGRSARPSLPRGRWSAPTRRRRCPDRVRWVSTATLSGTATNGPVQLRLRQPRGRSAGLSRKDSG